MHLYVWLVHRMAAGPAHGDLCIDVQVCDATGAELCTTACTQYINTQPDRMHEKHRIIAGQIAFQPAFHRVCKCPS